jgi:hypothetical protein
MSLASLQVAVRSWLHEGGDELPQGVGQDALAGLRVYRNNYRSQLIACLETSFPMTLAWLGGEAFDRMCEHHVRQVPPSSWTIDAYAAQFPLTIRALYPNDLEVGELAWIEWALSEAFVRPDQRALSPEDMATVDWDRARLELSSSILLAEAATNAGAIWSALASGAAPPAARSLEEAAALLVWRAGFEARFRTIDALEHDALQSLRAGASFEALCETLVHARGAEEGVGAAANLLGRWIGDGLIVGVDDDPAGGPRALDLPAGAF